MNHPLVRFLIIIAVAGAILAAIGIGAYQLSNIWIALGSVVLSGWGIGRILGEGMFFGALFAQAGARTDQPDFEDARHADLDDTAVVEALQGSAELVTDADLQEALHHFTHLATFCPGSVEHAERLQVVLEHLQMRLSASTVQPMSAEERRIVH